ncbi:50S ribosomal protein L25/general stress protein Ctc [Actimicrobium sp. CCI2.3]|uniref:50S ribosomal protein L25/general stress protein Ctc n=1 Tax=Actimicrobium sp. CCI2.3 TaxID=3048616 RepID=UPI002AB50180|nr:50S ribosomal protein L25/general stress protein Ctc [Actimicrobium sp. CCI2.3]MDY7576281.1 50S ribosomal protein L25/general stress protein Ctc [Actimicrobium sp. CCI2.3]MEB0020516.1 50S ribosomal protein L25/general stress protein Ctc [Actimicrobium sp. CCI2.3]
MKVIAFARTALGTGASRRQRIAGQTPGIVYGGSGVPVNISLDHNALYHALKKETFHSSILDLEIDGKVEKVLLRDFQVHAYKQLVLHADFQRVDASQKIHVKVPLHFINGDASPAVKMSAGIISHVISELEVTCLPADLPEFLTVDLGELEIGASIHLEDLKLPNGVSPVIHGGDDNPTIAAASVPAGRVEEAADAAAALAAQAANAPADKK